MADPNNHEYMPRRKDGHCKAIVGARICGLGMRADCHLRWAAQHPQPRWQVKRVWGIGLYFDQAEEQWWRIGGTDEFHKITNEQAREYIRAAMGEGEF